MARENRKLLTDLIIARMKPPEEGQLLVWDAVQSGLALLIGKNSKTFRSHFKLHGRYASRSIGRADQIMADSPIAWARERVREDRKLAANNIDPREHVKASERTFGFVLEQFIELHARPRQRTAKETERMLRLHCAAWMARPIDTITTQDAYKLLDALVREGKGPTARICLSWLRTMWQFAAKRKLVADPTTLHNVELNIVRNIRDRVFSDEEIAAIWNAAGELNDVFRAYTRIAILTAPRKSALAKAKWTDLDDPENPTLWTTPFELTKSRKNARPRVYLTPLCPLASELFKSLPRKNELIFPSSRGPKQIHAGSTLKRELVRHGAPADFHFHALRHSMASHFTDATDFEIGLLLNHSGSQSVTQGYRHSYALDLKRKLLQEWADHVAKIVA